MLSDYHYAYLIGDLLVGFPIWAFLFYFRKDLRREMLIAGVLLGVLSVVTEHWYWDYWHPEELNVWRLVLGDFFYGFFPGAAACVVYEGVFGKHFAKRKNRRHHWSWFFIPLITLGAFVFYIPLRLGISSMHSTPAALLLIAAIIVYFRKDLLWDAVLSSAFFGVITFVGYLFFLAIFPGIIHAWWLLPPNVSGIFILGIPLEELLFGFALGAAMGPAYEFFAGLQFGKKVGA